MLVALIEVGLDAVPVVDLDLGSDLPHRRADSLERTILGGLHHAYLQGEEGGQTEEEEEREEE